jgi:hypothetical protein
MRRRGHPLATAVASNNNRSAIGLHDHTGLHASRIWHCDRTWSSASTLNGCDTMAADALPMPRSPQQADSLKSSLPNILLSTQPFGRTACWCIGKLYILYS